MAKLKTIKINRFELFRNTINIRQYLEIGMQDYAIYEIADDLGIDCEDVEEILKAAEIYIRLNDLPKYIEIEVGVADESEVEK